MAGLKPRELNDRAEQLHGLLSSGCDDETARGQLGVGRRRYQTIKARMYEQQAEVLRSRTTEQVFVDYIHAQMACVHELNALIDRYNESKQANAVCGAARAISEIVDKIHRTGESLGVTATKPQETRITARVAVASLADDELRALVVEEMKALDDLVQTYAEVDITAMESGPLHRPATSEGRAKRSRTVRARTAKVARGRRVTRGVEPRKV